MLPLLGVDLCAMLFLEKDEKRIGTNFSLFRNSKYLYIYIKRKIDLYLTWKIKFSPTRFRCCAFSRNVFGRKENGAYAAFYAYPLRLCENFAF
jgi:hypothetical protein